jgi:hypothetical protein
MGQAGFRFAVVIVVAALMIGCGNDPSAPAVSEIEARSKADDMLSAYNSDDHEAASRDWSDEFKDEIDRGTFESSREPDPGQKGSLRGDHRCEARARTARRSRHAVRVPGAVREGR